MPIYMDLITNLNDTIKYIGSPSLLNLFIENKKKTCAYKITSLFTKLQIRKMHTHQK